jgi:hypothetical protein
MIRRSCFLLILAEYLNSLRPGGQEPNCTLPRQSRLCSSLALPVFLDQSIANRKPGATPELSISASAENCSSFAFWARWRVCESDLISGGPLLSSAGLVTLRPPASALALPVRTPLSHPVRSSSLTVRALRILSQKGQTFCTIWAYLAGHAQECRHLQCTRLADHPEHRFIRPTCVG